MFFTAERTEYRLKDTALAWLMPTNTATQRITLDHSRLNLCGSPSRLSMHGYNRPISAEETKRVNMEQHNLVHYTNMSHAVLFS